MPFTSKRQARFFFAAEKRHDLPKGTASRWAHHTKDMSALPEKKANFIKISNLMKVSAPYTAMSNNGANSGQPGANGTNMPDDSVNNSPGKTDVMSGDKDNQLQQPPQNNNFTSNKFTSPVK